MTWVASARFHKAISLQSSNPCLGICSKLNVFAGLVGKFGACCLAWSGGGPPQLDRDGECCGSGIDACGACGGNATVIDVAGG